MKAVITCRCRPTAPTTIIMQRLPKSTSSSIRASRISRRSNSSAKTLSRVATRTLWRNSKVAWASGNISLRTATSWVCQSSVCENFGKYKHDAWCFLDKTQQKTSIVCNYLPLQTKSRDAYWADHRKPRHRSVLRSGVTWVVFCVCKAYKAFRSTGQGILRPRHRKLKTFCLIELQELRETNFSCSTFIAIPITWVGSKKLPSCTAFVRVINLRSTPGTSEKAFPFAKNRHLSGRHELNARNRFFITISG